MNDKEIVSVLRACLSQRLGQERFDLWFATQTRLTVREESLLVETANRFAQDWIRSHFRRDLELTCEETLGRTLAVEVRVDSSLAKQGADGAAGKSGANNKANDGAVGDVQQSLPLEFDEPIAGAATNGNSANGGATNGQSVAGPSPIAGRINGAAPAATKGRRFALLETFVVGSSNRLAHATAQMVAEQPGRFTPLLVHGPTGVGKTHLLEGIWRHARSRSPNLQAVYLSAEQFTTHFVEALHGSGLPNFRRKYRGVELLIVDDVQFFKGKTATLNELIHTTDALLREGKQVILASDQCPVGLRSVSSELADRVRSGMVCCIDSPDYQTRLGIVRRLAQKIGLTLADDVAELIATHLTAHARELAGAINRLEAVSLIQQQPITRALAEEALAEMIRHSVRPVKLADIDQAVCEVFGLEAEDLHSARRSKNVSGARMLAMYLARKHTRAPLSEIGQHFGRRSHSTVISAQKTVGGWVAQQLRIPLSGKDCAVEDAIRKVEERLRLA